MPLIASAGVLTIEVFTRVRVGVLSLTSTPAPGTACPAANVAARDTATGITLGRLAEELGASPFECACSAADDYVVASNIEMLANNCDIVLIAGHLTDAQRLAAQAMLERKRVEDLVCQDEEEEFEALQVFRVGRKPVIALSAELGQAFAAFALVVAPLLRKMQGRSSFLPSARGALLSGDANTSPMPSGLFYVREVGSNGSMVTIVAPCVADCSALVVAQSTGLGWRNLGESGTPARTIAYFPFYDCLV